METVEIDMTPEPKLSPDRGRRQGCFRYLEPMETAIAKTAITIMNLKTALTNTTDPVQIKKLEGQIRAEEWSLRRMPLAYPDQPTKTLQQVDDEIDAILAAEDAKKQ